MKDIVCWDVETTGLNPKEDFIIQLSLLKLSGIDLQEIGRRNWFIKPAHGYTIHPDAEKVHGITKEFLEKNGVSIKDIGDDFMSFIKNCDILSYNGNSFDIKFIDKDFKMWGYNIFNEDRKYYDAYALEARFFPRNLSAVYKKYTGKEFENAHDSMSDVEATCSVFRNQLVEQKLQLSDIQDWNECNLISPEGSIRNASVGDNPRKIVFAVGKYKDSDVADICKNDPSYIKWFFESVASDKTKQVIKEYFYEKYPK